MIDLTATRLHAHQVTGLEIGRTLVIGSKRHERLLHEQMPDAALILEPFGRNSAPAVAAACLASAPDDLILILPADHDIAKPGEFLKAIALAQTAADDGAIVTFGIQPTHAATGYGYIEADSDSGPIKTVEQFVEKPPAEKAQAYLESGNYYWNAGIFMFKASVMLAAFEKHAPVILQQMKQLVSAESSEICHLDPVAFAEVEDISIDYAIMEHETNIKVVPVNMGWSDVGGYDALWDMFAESADDNVEFGPVVTQNCARLFARSEGPLICASGVEDLVIVAKPDVVMVVPSGDAAAIKALGKAAQAAPDTLSISDETSATADDILTTCFNVWAECAWDQTQGGFLECLTLSGEPDTQSDRRVRVQARQVYSFARAISLEWAEQEKASALVSRGLEYLNTVCRHPDGGWVHRISAKGETVDETRDLYDHAFIMMAGAAAYAATGNQDAMDLANEALQFIDQELADPDYGGYFESKPAAPLRRANPHMHLLEAFLALHHATGERDYLDRATKIVSLFERHFFDPDLNILREYFTADWKPAPGVKGTLFEPGHHYEWATLLAFHARLTGRDTLSWRRRLIQTADLHGRDKVSGFAHNSALPDGEILDEKRRIWHQLEMFRARLLHPETAPPGDADRVFAALKATYFDGMPSGTWRDETDASGHITSTAIPASILYHLVTAFSPALRS